MDKKLKAKWVKALTGGKYKQTRGALKDPATGGYCCLGVLLTISRKGKWDGPNYEVPTGDGEVAICQGDLQAHIADDLGIPGYHEAELISMNDTYSKNFKEIAAYIKAKL